MSIGVEISTPVNSCQATTVDGGRLSKRRLLDYRSIMTFGIVLLLYSNVPVVLGRYGISVDVWVALCLTLAAPISLVGVANGFRINAVIIWGYAFVLVTVLGVFVADDAFDARAALIARGMYLVVFLTVYLLAASARGVIAGLAAMLITVLISTTVNIIEYFNSGMFSNITDRSAGLYLNPNRSAHAIVLGMALSAWIVPQKFRLAFYMFCGVGVIATLSRGGLICWLIAVMALLVCTGHRRFWKASYLIVLAATIVMATPLRFSVAELIERTPIHSDRTIQRVLVLNSESIGDDMRVSIAKQATTELNAHPLVGSGTGLPLFDQGNGVLQGPHNMYLSLAVQYGYIGFALVPLLALALLRARTNRVMVVPFVASFLIVALFSHGIFDQWHFAVAIAVAGRMYLFTEKKRD